MPILPHILTLVILSFGLAFAPLTVATEQGLPGAAATTRAEQWRQDLKYLATELPRHHANAFHSISRTEFNRAVAELDKAIPALQDHEIILGFRRILALVGDGHTNLFGWESSFHRYPFRFFRFSDGYFVTRATSEQSKLLGMRLAKIGTLPVDDAYKAVIRLLPQGEGELYLRHYAPVYLSFAEVEHALHMQTSPAKGEFVFEDSTAREFSVELSPLPTDAEVILADAARQTPLYREQPNQPLWYKYLPESKTVFFEFRGYPPYPEFLRFSAELLEVLDKNPVERLVVDLRANTGGDEGSFQPLLEGIIRNDKVNRKGHLFVIIGRATYSAGMLNAVQLKLRTNAILFGEPTGAKPNQYNESSGDQALKLPNSGLKVDYSIRYRQLLKQDSPALMPDVPVSLSSSDYIAGRDPVLEKILAYEAL